MGFFDIFKASPQREARRLNKDAASIIDMARGTYRESVLSEIARLTRDGLAQMADIAGTDPVALAREVDRYKALHREARRQHNQTRLTAYTLVIIHSQGLRYGELTEPTRESIDEFLAEWPEVEPPEGTLAG